MKLFLVISDTHGNVRLAKNIIEQYQFISSVIHLGDYLRDVKSLQLSYPDREFISVPGNCDYESREQHERLIEVENKRILITHGHRYDVKSGYGRLESRAVQEKVDAVLFGHTHIPYLKRAAETLFLNPGSLGYPRGLSDSTYAILEVGNGMIEGRILDA